MRRHRPQADVGQLPFAFVQEPIRLRYKLIDVWSTAAASMGEAQIEQAIIRAYREANSLRLAARRLNFSKTTVREKLIALGEPRRPRGGANNPYGSGGKPGRDVWHE